MPAFPPEVTVMPGESAAAHEWQSIVVRIWPAGDRARGAVHLRRHRGTDLLWSRALGRQGWPLSPEAEVESLAGALQAAGESLLALAQDAARRTP